MSCNKYCCVFREKNGKTWSRSGTVKRMECNFTKYIAEIQNRCDLSRLVKFEIYDQSQGTQKWDLEKHRYGFYVDEDENGSFNLSLIFPNDLFQKQIICLWNLFSEYYDMKYMVSFSLEASKMPEIYMYGIPIYPLDADVNTYYSDMEKLTVQRLYALRRCKTDNLEGVFPLCIVTEEVRIDESTYSFKEKIGARATLLSKCSK